MKKIVKYITFSVFSFLSSAEVRRVGHHLNHYPELRQRKWMLQRKILNQNKEFLFCQILTQYSHP